MLHGMMLTNQFVNMLPLSCFLQWYSGCAWCTYASLLFDKHIAMSAL